MSSALEQQLILEACRPRRADLQPLLSQPLDWPWILSKATENGVIPLLCQALQDEPLVPQSARGRLLDGYIGNIAHSLRLSSRLLDILALLQHHGVPSLAYKGPALASLAYGDAAMRFSSDLDILIRRSDLDSAKAALEAAGYCCPLSTGKEARLRREHYHLNFVAGDPPLSVELHWNITPAYWPFPLDTDRLWRGSASVPLLESRVATLDPELTLLAICAHGAKERWPRLALICDLAWLIERTPDLDWYWIEQKAVVIGRTRVLLLGLLLARSLLGASIPEPLLAQARADADVTRAAATIARHIFTGVLPDGLTYHRYSWSLWNQASDRHRYLRHAAGELPGKLGALLQPSEADKAAPGLLSWFWRPVRVLYQHRDPRRLLTRIGNSL